ncbi:MAG: heavy metal translocating P-type ATPase metal-binding domain-containing protein, partial [Bacteroidia bacterium]|nr:heavy metal translocating P-type ATPase metal-binding domain-containing protein [Bacteroidia bacterium]
MIQEKSIKEKIACFHCGDVCISAVVKLDDKTFCCEGCKMVYEIINSKGLCEYYDKEKTPGLSRKIKVREGKFDFLNDKAVRNKLIHFKNETDSHVTFYLPQMHCSSCVWLLEQMHRVNAGIIHSQVNFLKKEIKVVYNHHKTNLKEVAEALTAVGYEPHISLNDVSSSKKKVTHNKKKIYKIGVAGFCFGNIMMLSFPEYFSLGAPDESGYYKFFSYLNLLLALPVFFYSASEFFVSSYKSLKQKFLNIDAPIALAIVITFSRSVYEILTHTGAGYLDSMSGIVFFMLLGRYFQDITYDTLSFERDYTSYFPLGVSVINQNGTESQIPVSKLKIGDRIKIHHGEIVPADSILFLGKASIDYSFVTGESIPVEKTIGEIVYAGGKQTQGAIELEVVKEVAQSYLTQLWNNDSFKESNDEKKKSFIHNLSTWFTYILFSVAIVTGLYWWIYNPANVLNSITAILIVACPCALLLSATFTNGNILRYMGRNKLYVKNANAVERMSEADAIVFDKTGTITYQKEAKINYQGNILSTSSIELIKNLAQQSNHPLSKAIVSFLPESKKCQITKYIEEKGNGISGTIENNIVKIGSANFVGVKDDLKETNGSRVWLSINNMPLGCFYVENLYREELEKTVNTLKKNYSLYILSGDNENERANIERMFGKNVPLKFNQKPEDKLNFIKHLQSQNKKVIMFGDGLNDAGALKESYVGVSVT